MDISDNLKNFPVRHKQHYSLIQKTNKQTTDEGHKHINTFYIFCEQKIIKSVDLSTIFFQLFHSYFSEVIFKIFHTVRIYHLK